MFLVVVGHEETVGLHGVSSDAAAELVELGESKSFGVFDDHDGGGGDVDSNFDDGGGDEDIEFLVFESSHDGVFFFWSHFSVKEFYFAILEYLADAFVFGGDGFGFDFVGFVDEWADPEYLASFGDLVVHEVFHFLFFVWFGDDAGDDGFASGGEFVDDA